MAASSVTLKFSREGRNDEYGMNLYKEAEPNYPWVLTLDGLEGSVAYFKTRYQAKAYAEAIATRQEKLREALRLIDVGPGMGPDPAALIAREALGPQERVAAVKRAAKGVKTHASIDFARDVRGRR